MIDCLSGIMNRHNPRAKGFKGPLGAFNLEERKAFLSHGALAQFSDKGWDTPPANKEVYSKRA